MTSPVIFVVPGSIATRTGGYEYDRRVIAALQAYGWPVSVRELPDRFPFPDAAARRAAAELLASLDDGAVTVVDGLAMGALPDEVTAHAARLRIVALVHHPLALESGLDAARARQLEESERLALRAARHVIVTSPATADALTAYGVEPARRSVVVPGVEAAPLAHGSQAHVVHVLCIGSVVPRKGYHILISALARLLDLPWTLFCGGSLDRDPDYAREIETAVQTAGMSDRVEFLGELSESRLGEQYDRADLFVLPTLYEGYGMVVAEALARGVPVVASDTGGIGPLLAREAGLVVPPGNVEALAEALRRAIGNPDLRRSLADGARQARLQLRTWQAAGEEFARVLEKVSAS